MPPQHNNKELYLKIRELARHMRTNATEAEMYFWEKVRDRRLLGLKWNRQFIIQCRVDPCYIKYYIADFHCHEYKLIVELDGHIHLKKLSEDLIRTEEIALEGFEVLRFTNEEVLNNWEAVKQKLLDYQFSKSN